MPIVEGDATRVPRRARLMPAAMAAVCALAALSPASAQSESRGTASITIGEVLMLRVVPGGGAAAASAEGEYRELSGAVRVEIIANGAWRLEAVQGGASGRTASADGLGAPEEALWWRASASPGSRSSVFSRDYVRAERWPLPVAQGDAGRHVVELDYRWLDARGRESAPGVMLHFALITD